MKTKLEMAHDYAMLHMMNTQYKYVDDLEMVQWAFDYADAMQDEEDKREQHERDKHLQAKQNHKDELDSIVLEQWQPDWSQAPKEYPTVTGWYIFRNKAHWICDDVPCGPAPTFGITGNHIVERRTI